MRFLLTITLVIALGYAAQARAAFSGENDWFFYAGLSAEASPVGTARLGNNSWEVGLIASRLIGFDKIFKSESLYSAWGLGFVPDDQSGGLGFYAAVGWEPRLFWGLTFRTELGAVAGTNAYEKGGLYVGLGFHF